MSHAGKRLSLAVLLSGGLAACGQQAAHAPSVGRQVAAQGKVERALGRYVVVFKNNALPADAAARIEQAGGKALRKIGAVGVAVASGNAAFAAALARDSAVLAVGPEHRYALPPEAAQIPAADALADATGAPTAEDSLYNLQWDIRRVNAPSVWNRVPLSTQRRSTVAVLDVGVMDTHPDLQGQVTYQKSTSYCDALAGKTASAFPEYGALIDFDAHPDWNPSDGCTPVAPSYEAHGTHVSGTVAGKFGGGKIVGVGPGLQIAAYKVFDRYRYTDDQGVVSDDVGGFDGPIFEAVMDAADHHFGVINMSLGSSIDRSNKDDNASWLAWNRVANYATKQGTLLVVSAGNSEENSNGTLAHIPSDLPSALSVSATGTTTDYTGGTYNAAPGSDVLAFYSNYGAATDISAPGGDCGVQPSGESWCALPREQRPAGYRYHLILSSVILDKTTPSYAFYAGTSMAAPHVAAVAGLVRALHPDWSPAMVRAQLQSTAQKVNSRQEFGHGVVDADAAVR